MPYIPHTPEALLPRSDSKNPATTCKGITSGGRPCRRALATKTKRPSGVLAVVSVGENEDAAAFFCWQHKDQAEQLVAKNSLERVEEETTIVPLRERSSIDTLVQRLGVLQFEESAPVKSDRRKERRPRESRTGQDAHPQGISRPKTWESVSGPVMLARRSDPRYQKPSYRPNPVPPQPRPRKVGFWAALCCGAADEDVDGYKQVRRRSTNRQHPVSISTAAVDEQTHNFHGYSPGRRTSQSQGMAQDSPHRLSHNNMTSSVPVPARKPLGEKPARPINQRATVSDSEKSPIPTTLPPEVRTSILRYLMSPPSTKDEPGYIYMFWLTDAEHAPPQRTASTLLSARPDLPRGRRASDVLSDYSGTSRSQAKNTRAPKKILLKIGRTDNVWRRMREWGQQCRTVPNLLRYYPYVTSSPVPSPTPSPAGTPQRQHDRRLSLQPSAAHRPDARRSSSNNVIRQVPHATRVERLIHLELADKQVDVDCKCGTVHREWFEIEATMEGVRAVDEVIRRWVDWDESGKLLRQL